jgi:serine/threonine-protein kinase
MPDFQSEPNAITKGQTLDGRYLIQKIIGKGRLGRTYLAFDLYRFNEPCVIKEFAPLVSSSYDAVSSRNLFIREAKILNYLNHPQIPKFFGHFEAEGRFCLVREYIQGQTYGDLLQQRLKQHRVINEPEVIELLIDILPVIEYIHQQKVVHRDISPDNIIQPDNGQLPILIDFGMGKLISEVEGETIVNKKSFVGKIGYAPREQITLGIGNPSSDIYALGVTMLVLLTGKQPTLLLNRQSSVWQWEKYVRLSKPLAEIIDRAIAINPQARYQSAAEMERDVRDKIIQAKTIVRSNSSPNSPIIVSDNTKDRETLILDPLNRLNSCKSSSNKEQTNNFFPENSFIKRCKQELTYCLGIQAKPILEEILARANFNSPASLVESLAQKIPDAEKATWFKQRLL